MRLSYCGMEIDISLEGLLEVEYLEWHEALNSHGQVNICFLAEEEQMEDILFRPGQAAEITVSEQTGEGSFQRAFCGKAVRLRGRKERGLFFLQAEFAGFTKEWDLVPGSRSFCRTAQPYGEVLREVIREYPEKDIRDEVTGGKATGAMLLQYEETDWEFLKRLAGHFSSFLVADSTCSWGRVYFGLPVLDYGVSLQYGEYRISRNRDEYDRISRSRNGYAVTDLLPQELSRWTIRCRRRLHLAETVRFCGVETVVSELEFHTEHGELVREYTLCRKAGLMSRRAGNPAVAGMSLPATVKERSGNRVRVHMDIDREYCGGDDCAYFTYAIESSSIYCMPEVGSRVHIYFPGPDEAAAVAVHAISTGAAAGRNPADKSFSTPAGMSMDLNRDSYRFDAGGSCLSIGTDGTVRISGTRIRFTTQGEFSVGKAVQPAGIQAEAENGMHLHVGDTSITMTENTEAVSGFIAHMAAKKSAPFPSAESIEQEVKAGDGALLASFNQGAEAHLRTMADQQILAKQQARAEEQIRRGAMGLAGFVLVTGLVVASGGLAAAALGTAAAAGGMQASLLGLGAVAAFMGTNTFMGAAAELHQGVTDYNRALEGEISSTGNLFQTALGMNDRSYAAFMAANNLMYQSVTMTASTANLFSRMFTGISGCTARQLARSGTMFAVQTGKSVIDQYGTTGRIDLAGMLVDGGIGAVSASAGGLAGKYALRGLDQAGLKLPLLAQLGIQSAAAGVVGGTADFALHLPLAQGMVTASDLANTMIMYAGGHAGSTGTMMILDPGAFSIGDPVSAITGAYTAVETDLAVAGIRSALVWERKYDSLRQKSGILGKGWYSPMEGQLCRKEDGDLQVEIPAGAVLLFGQVDGGYKEAGEARGRYGLEADTGDRKWVLTDFHTHEKLEYDQEGRLTAMADAGGRRTLLHYEQGTLACLVTPLGHRLYFVFREGRLVQASDDIGRTVRYHYEGGLLAEVVNPAGGSIRYRYSGEGRLITASDCAGSAYLANEYDRQGRVIRQFLGDREVAALEYRDDRGETAVRTRYGTAVFRYSRMKLPVRIIYPDGTDLCFRYDSCHRCIYRKDRRGNTDLWSYDEQARPTSHRDTASLETFYEYSEAGDLVREWDSAGRETRYVHDRQHQVTQRRTLRDRESGQWDTARYEYDSMGRLTKETSPAGRSVSYTYEKGCGKPAVTTYGDGERVLREYDTMERMMAKEDSCGRTEYGYSTRDEISLVRDGEGNETRKLYDSLGRLTGICPPGGDLETGKGVTRFRYNFMRHQDDTIHPDGSHERRKVDWEGTVLKKIHPCAYDPVRDDGEGETCDYDWDRNLVRIHYPDGGVERFFRDGNGNCVKHVLPEDYDPALDDGPGYSYTYDEGNRLTEVAGPDGTRLAWYRYDHHGNMTLAGTPDGGISYFWYDLAGNLVQKAEPAPLPAGDGTAYCRTSYTWDGDGRQTGICFDGGKWALVEEEAEGGAGRRLEKQEAGKSLVLSCTCDARGRLVQVTDGSGARVRYEYDVRGNRTREEQTISEEITRTVCYRYDRAGRLKEKRELAVGWTGEESRKSVRTAVTAYGRDANGNITEIRTPEGYRIIREYDLRDRLVCERMVDEKNGIDRSTLVSYDRAGNVVSLCRKGADGRKTEITCQYDLKDRLVQASSMEGAVFAYQYDRNDRLVEEKRPSAGHARGTGTWNYRYDGMGRLTERRNPDGQLEEWNRYDKAGRRTVRKLADGEEFHFQYGAGAGELLSGISSTGSREEGRNLQTYRYNSRGQITGTADGNGNETGYVLDAWGKLTEIRAADGGTERYTYDYAGNTVSATDANGGTIHYRYNSQGKVCEITDQDGLKERFVYDREGRQILSTDRLGNRVETEYNIDGNPVRRTSSDSRGKNRDVQTWEYDCLGYVKRAVGGGFSYRYEYRPDGKLLWKESSGRTVLRYTYFPDGSVKTMTDGSGKTLSYGYDQAGRLISVADEKGEIAGYTRTPGGKVKEIRHRNGVRTVYGYDTEGNILRLRTETGDGETICDLQYAYDLNGNRTARTGTLDLPDHRGGISRQDRKTRYRYDSMNRLTAEAAGEEETCYVYDLCGNRLEKRKGGMTERYRYSRKNQLTRRETEEGVWNYTFDPQGNLARETGPAGERQYLYDGANRQIRILAGGKELQENRYDGEGLRAGVTVNGKSSTFLYADGNLYGELDEGGRLTSRYIRGAGLSGLEHQGTLYAVHQDEQLSIGWITGKDGTTENAYEYDAFGTLLGSHGNIPCRLLYSSQQYDGETEQYYLRARYYNPVTGRFMQEDAYRGDGLNLYAYCANNPVMYYDPSGESSDCNHGADVEKNAQKENVTGEEGSRAQSSKVLGGSFENVNANRADNEVGHHLPQNAFNVNELGMTRAEGPALLMTKDDHALTRTYRGKGKHTMISDQGLTARQRMTLDIINIHETFGTKYNKGLLEAISYSKTLPQFQR